MNLDGFNVSYEINKSVFPYCKKHIAKFPDAPMIVQIMVYVITVFVNVTKISEVSLFLSLSTVESSGDFCEYGVCESADGSNPCQQGHCIEGRCECFSSSTHGDLCQSHSSFSVWDKIHSNSISPNGTASHASIEIDDTIWTTFGETFDGNRNSETLSIFNVSTQTWSNTESSGVTPNPRFDHTVVKYKVICL